MHLSLAKNSFYYFVISIFLTYITFSRTVSLQQKKTPNKTNIKKPNKQRNKTTTYELLIVKTISGENVLLDLKEI